MPGWSSSNRRDRLPPDWPKRRSKVLRNAKGMCQWRYDNGTLCLAPANQVDHILHGDDHSLANLQALCFDHHKRKSSGEGARALAEKRREINKKFRRVEEHPGLL